MKIIHARNVNEAFYTVMNDVICTPEYGWRTISPRDGRETLEFKSPVMTVYECPRERVLTNYVRDANPFFHLMEALWILSGSDSVPWIAQFNGNIASYSDDGLRFHGAYGYRMRTADNGDDQDQVSDVIRRLIEEPDTRRAVISLYDPNTDFQYEGLDLPCNTHIYFKLRNGLLDMTVCCRSNDVIWGAYGANAVHFSILQEYIAAAIDSGIGRYRQYSDSFHVYTDNPVYQRLLTFRDEWLVSFTKPTFYNNANVTASVTPLVESRAIFDDELKWFMSRLWNEVAYDEPFFRDVAVPMRMAYESYKEKNYNLSLEYASCIKSPDWRWVSSIWIKRRTLSW